MTITRGIGWFFGRIINGIVGALALSRVHPNVLTFIGLLINIWGAFLFGAGKFRAGGIVVLGAGLFDMVDGRVAREDATFVALARIIRELDQVGRALRWVLTVTDRDPS